MTLWRRLRSDEYQLGDEIFRVSKDKEQRIQEFDRRVFEEKRYA